MNYKREYIDELVKALNDSIMSDEVRTALSRITNTVPLDPEFKTEKQKLIDQAQQIADDDCIGIDCINCVLHNPKFECYPGIVASAFLSGIALEKENHENN